MNSLGASENPLGKRIFGCLAVFFLTSSMISVLIAAVVPLVITTKRAPLPQERDFFHQSQDVGHELCIAPWAQKSEWPEGDDRLHGDGL